MTSGRRHRLAQDPRTRAGAAAVLLVAVVAVAAAVLGGAGGATVAPAGATSDADATLRERVEALEARVDALEGVEPTATASPTGGASAGPVPSSAPSSPGASPGSPGSSPASPADLDEFPTRESAGVPDGWTPARTVTGDLTVRSPGAVVSDVRINGGDLLINAPGVVVRRVEIVGGHIDNYTSGRCAGGMRIEDTTIRRGDAPTTDRDLYAIGMGGYTATNVLVDGKPEGFRVGGDGACGPVSVSDSYVRVVAPDQCEDWHGDGLQGYDGDALTLRNTVLVLDGRPGCEGTAPFFYPAGQGNTSVDVDGLVVSGGGYSFRLGTPGSVRDLVVVDQWIFAPVNVACDRLSTFEARTVSLDALGLVTATSPATCEGAGR